MSSADAEKWIASLVAIAVVLIVSQIAQRSAARRLNDVGVRYRVRKALALASYAISLLVILTIFSDRLGGFTVAFGVAGAGIAFALQEVIASAAGWIAISFGNFYSPGNRVELGGIKGDVIDIGILRTTLMEVGQWVDGDLYNGRIVRVANSFVFKEPVVNYSADFPFLWDEIRIPVRYGSDWKYARQILQQVADETCSQYAKDSEQAWAATVRRYALEAARLEPAVTMVANDNWLELTLRYVADYRSRRATKDRLYTRFLEEVDKSGDRVRLASATVEIVNLPTFDVAIKDGSGSVRSRYSP